jgi:hypothetical protein
LLIEEVRELRGFAVEWAEPENFYLSRRNRIFHSRRLQPPFTPVAEIGAPTWKRTLSASRLAQRALRFMVTNVLVLANGDLFVTFDKEVGVVRDGTWRSVSGLSRPCRVLRGGCAITRQGDVFFGEYRLNTERREIGVYKYSPGSDSVGCVHTFAPGEIAHVHGIYRDRESEDLYCLTGDTGHECRILRTRDGFASLEVLGEGDESWRAVSALFSDASLYYGTDASLRTNYLYRVDRVTLKRETLAEVDGPVLYSTRIGDDLLFATSAEGAPSQADDVASLWHLTAEGRCRRIASFRKDRWHRTLFKLGAIHFPGRSALEQEVYFHLVAVVGDNRTFRLLRTTNGSPNPD